MNTIKFKIIQSPVGLLKIVIENKKLVAILWDNERPDRVVLDQMIEDDNDPLLLEIATQLNQYFRHQRTVFDLPMEPQGTPFQEAVWQVLCKIPYGVTWTYKEIAEKINNPKAVRAVGAAIGRNPISIIIPCHRVIGTNGTLTGFAGGLDRKKVLLDLEAVKE